MSLAALVDPTADRIYGHSLDRVVEGEWAHIARLRGLESSAEVRRLGDHLYLVVECGHDVRQDHVDALRLTTTSTAVFGLAGPDRLEILPATTAEQPLSSSILTIQRYRGKTNERFTRMLLHFALAAIDGVDVGAPIRVLDPLSGRGTTVNAAVQRGLSATGIEIEENQHRDHVDFLSRWFRDQRLKHRLDKAHVRDASGRRTPSARIEYARTKDDFKSGGTAVVDLVAGDSTMADRWFTDRSFDCLVADLPYGVQHGAKKKSEGRDHWIDATGVLEHGLPVWSRMLRPRSSVVLSWNLRTLGRESVVESLDAAGFDVVGGAGESLFVHRVDHTIQRDLAVAIRRSADPS